MYTIIIHAVTSEDMKSEAGSEAHTPLSPKNNGKTTSSGNRNSSWRDMDRKMLMRTLPMHWKKLVITI